MEKRLDELCLLLEEGDLSRLTRRLLDFAVDFEMPVALRQEVVGLRAAFNQSEKDETSDKSELLLQKADRIMDSLEELELKALEASEREWSETVFLGKSISKTFRTPGFLFQLPALDFELKRGEITGVVGENGNGKTTLLRIVAGELKSDSGEIDYPTFDLNKMDWYNVRGQIAFIPQQLGKWQGFLKDNLHFAASIHGIKGEENERRVNFIIHRLGLSRYENALWSEISSGYKLRFALAKALVWKPRLLIIDEPLANLDINTQQLFLQDLQYLAKSSSEPIAILLTSQHLHEVESIADNIIFLRNGEALYNGKMAEFGSDRDENLYELTSDSSKQDLLLALKGIAELKIEDQGKVKLIHTAPSISSANILAALGSSDINIQYFRDISTSTLKLFRSEIISNG